MKPSLARIEKFISSMEASLAPPIDRTKWIRLLSLEPGETREAAVRRHLQEHPEDREQAEWMAWLWTGVPRCRREEPLPDGVGRPAYQGDINPPQIETAPEKPAATERHMSFSVEKPAASPVPEKPALKAEPEPEPIVPWGFGRRKTYNALTDDYE
jgi:hypothetical protein